jgi:hypothetical protein
MPGIQTREFDHVPNSGSLARIYKRALGFDHIHEGSRDHKDSVNTIESSFQAGRRRHIALGDFNAGNIFEFRRLRSVPYQDPYWLSLPREFVRYEGTSQTSCTCQKSHCNLLCFALSSYFPSGRLILSLIHKTGVMAGTHRCPVNFSIDANVCSLGSRVRSRGGLGRRIPGGVFMGLISFAIPPSLHEGFDAGLPGSQARGPDTPDLPLIDACVFFAGGGEADVCEDVKYRLAGSRRRLAVTRQRDPVAVPGLDVTCRSSSMRPSARTRR